MELHIHGSRDPLLGSSVGGYRLLARLGEGAVGVVYRAEGPVAVKLLRPELARDEEYRQRFLREQAIGVRLQHPSVVRTLKIGEEHGQLYLVMEFLTGRTLTAHMAERLLSLSEAVWFGRALAAALAYAHGQGTVHRDVKPDNVMLESSGPKLMDFGLALDGKVSRVTKSGVTLGTPAYMAPEAITGAPPSPFTDQYSLGVLMFEMLTGRRPFESPNPMLLSMAHLTDPVPSMRGLRPEIPAELEEAVVRMLAKDPLHRHPDLESLTRTLR